MPLYSRVTIYLDDDVTPMVTVSTDPAHAHPYLIDDSLMYGESKIDFPNGSAGIGQFGFKLLDKRTVPADQTTGFFTALLADAGGRGNIMGHRVVWERQQIGGVGAYVTQFDGIADDCKLDDDLVMYQIPCRDVRERERTNRIFTKHNKGTSLLPNGPVAGWGLALGLQGRPGSGGKMIPPVTPLRGQFWRDPIVPTMAGRIKTIANVFDLMIGGTRYQALQNYGALTQGNGLVGGDTSVAFRNVIIWWRAFPGGGAWTELSNMPAIGGTEYPMQNVFPQGVGTFEGAENRSFVAKNDKEKVNLYINLTGAGIPTHLQQVEFMVLANGQPTDEAPIYWEGNLGQLTKEIYDGTWSNFPPGIRYDAAAMADFIARSVQGAALIKAPVENGLQWVQENTYKPQGWAPSVPPETGLVTPIHYDLPNATTPLLSLTNSIVKEDAKWELSKDELINEVNFEYEAIFIRDSKYPTQFSGIDALSNANKVEPPAQRIGTIPITYVEVAVDSQALLGAKVLKYTPETIKLFGILTPDGLDTRMWPDIGAKLAKDRTKEVLDRFTFGGQRLTVNARRTGSGVSAAKMGDWASCGISWLPDYVSQKRGLNRLMQVVSVNDDDKVFRKLVLSDAGPNVTPSGIPVLGAVTQDAGIIDVAFTSIPAGVRANVDFAISVLEPDEDSGDWVSLGRTELSTDHLTLGPLPPGTSIWVRAVGEEAGKRRSAFTVSVNIVITNVPLILAKQITFDADGHPRITWQASSLTLGVRIEYEIFDSSLEPPALTHVIDVDATLGTFQLPDITVFGQAVAVRLTPYSGFTADGGGGGGGDWLANEPSGMTLIDERPFDTLEEHESPHDPAWFTTDNANRFIVVDVTALQSPPNALRCLFPAAFAGGSAGGLAECPLPGYRILYTAYRAKYSANWQGHGTGFNKQTYFWADGAPIVFFEAHGGGDGDMTPRLVLQGTPADAVLDSNLAPTEFFVRDTWFLVEMVFTGNTAANADGQADWWLNGVHAGHHTGLQFTTGDTAWETGQIQPIWGGAGDSVDFDMSLDFDHIYFSGKN